MNSSVCHEASFPYDRFLYEDVIRDYYSTYAGTSAKMPLVADRFVDGFIFSHSLFYWCFFGESRLLLQIRGVFFVHY